MKQRPFAVFDIDGTLIRWQLYHAVVDRLAKKDLLGKGAHKLLHDARMGWKRRQHPDAYGQYERELIKVYERALPTLSAEKFDQTVEEIANEYKEQVYTYTRDLAKNLKKQGYVLLAISGSHQELIKHICELYGFDDWVGTVYQRKNGKFSGEKFIASVDKRAALLKLIGTHNLSIQDSWAVGDSKSDAVLLEIVDNPVAFNPDSTLFDQAVKKGWDIVVERKDIIYKLEGHNGRYELVLT